MVGVPGRSKGCNTCKQRKIACSLERPECRTCIKSDRICAGYQRERIFLLDHRSKGDGPRTYQNPPAEAGHALRPPPRKKKDMPTAQRGSLYPSIHSHSSSITGTLSPSTRSVYRQQILSEFLSSVIPSLSKTTRQESIHELSASWLSLLPTLPDQTPVLETSILALCTATLGRIKGNLTLVHESLKFYTQGLWELQRALWDPKLMYGDETLAVCMILIIYEVTECPNRNMTGWLNHMRGCSKLFELRGPKSYDSEFSYKLFASFRLLEIQQAIAERRHTFLSSSQWINLPWKSRDKTQYHKFLDVMAQLPSVIADGYDAIGAVFAATASNTIDPKALLTKVIKVINRAWQLDAKFEAFYAEFEGELPGQLYWPELSQGTVTITDEEELGKVFPVAFQFVNMRIAHICVLYWASTAILWSGMLYLYRVMSDLQAQQAVVQYLDEEPPIGDEGGSSPDIGVDQLPSLGHRTDISSNAKDICQSFEYLILNENESPWTTRGVFPLKVSIEALHDTPGCEREELWGIAAMESISGGGVQILGNIERCSGWGDHAFLPG